MDELLRITAAHMTKSLQELPPDDRIDTFQAMRSAVFDGLYKQLQLQPDGTVRFLANPSIITSEGGGKKRRRHMTKRLRSK